MWWCEFFFYGIYCVGYKEFMRVVVLEGRAFDVVKE